MSKFNKTDILLCFCLFLVALGLRLSGSDYGYFHGDERVNDAAKVLAGQLIPGQHFYPPFINYVNAIALAVLFGVGLVADWWDGTAAFRDQYFSDPTLFYIAARSMTALWAAGLAVAFFLGARRLALSRTLSSAVALLAVFFPLSVFMSHIAKGDAALATMLVASFWALLARMDSTRPLRWDLVLGLCVTLTLSFKHSAIFVLFPLGLGWIVLLAFKEGLTPAVKSFAMALAVIIVVWPVLNIGLILDFEGFLDYQRIQAVMSLRGDGQSALDGLVTLAKRSLELSFGMIATMVIAAVFSPILILTAPNLRQKPTLLVIWGALAFGSVVTAVMTGARQPEHLWISNFAGFLFVGGLALASWAGSARSPQRWFAIFWLSSGILFGALGTSVVLRQANAIPIQQSIAQYLSQMHGDHRILTSAVLGLPQRKEAQQLELARLDRLAAKYNTPLPERAEERIIQTSAPNAVFYVNMPGVMFGLENVEDGEVDYEIKAHTWPMQPEEWKLGYWRDQGFELYVVQDFEYYAHTSAPKMRQDFLKDLAATCREIRRFEPVKPLFLEREVRIFDCVGE